LDCFEDANDSDNRTLTEGCPRDTANPIPEQRNNNFLYHLVDPAWVLALPQAECRALAYSSLPEHAQSPNRQSVCVDLASCISEDASGNCTGGYGYCTRERVTWQLTGSSCEPQYATCQSFTAPKPLNVLTAYVDNAGCSAQTAGCKWYSTVRQGETWNQDAKIYLNSNAQSCNASVAKSEEVIPLVGGVNYVKNSGFDEELFAERPSGLGSIGALARPAPEEGGWNFNGQPFAQAYPAGAGAIAPNDASQTITIKPFTYYTLSFFAFPNPNNAAATAATVEVSAGGPLKSVSFPDYSFAESSTLTVGVQDVGSYQGSRFAATFYSANETRVTVHLRAGAVYDDVQLEEIKLQDGASAVAAVRIAARTDVATLNTVPGSGSINAASPTTAYKPYGTENKSVFADAEECTAEETSARAYAPLSGGQAKYARLTADGLCSRECDGFDTFLEMPTAIEKLADPNVRPKQARFVPDRAASCTLLQVGCEAFTNVQTEAREHYNRIESCVADENPNAATFYTWEAGQLTTWQLLKDRSSDGPCTSFPQGARAGDVDPKTASCRDAQGGSPACVPGDGTLCRTFLDNQGVEYRRDANKVVTASSQCTQFRRTAGAGTTGESWYFIPSEANQCSSAAVGCREYKGAGANVVRRVYAEDFENGTGGWAGGALSNQSVEPTGRSYRITAGEGRDIFRSVAFANPLGKAYELRFRAKALGSGAAFDLIRLKTDDASGQQNRYFLNTSDQRIIVSNAWRDYRAGPLSYQPLGGAHDTQDPGLLIRAQGSDMVIDNIEIVEVPDVYYRLQSSTLPQSQGGAQPNICYAPQNPSDPTSTIRSCQAYRDDKSNTYYVSEFDKLFASARSLSCTAVIDTKNSDSPYSQAFNMGEIERPGA
ncbi:MAG: hypothetical protein HYW81_02540, partial [Parcubacteria group bacterium]|nr:hypothetical protein [Parcubacteria group bacterium]